MNYWFKQTQHEPLFPELQWSRPENKHNAGKLAIIGGNLFGFSAVGEAYNAALEAGIGTARVLLPESLRKVVLPLIPEAIFAASNPSGGFGQKALVEFMEASEWADATLLAGDIGKNSETAIVLEKFVQDYNGALIITKDCVDYFTAKPDLILNRTDTTLVLSIEQLQKLFQNAKSPLAITFSMDLSRLTAVLSDFTQSNAIEIVVKHLDQIVVAVNGEVSSTKLLNEVPVWRVSTAATAAVWRIQNSEVAFKALTTAMVGKEGLEPSSRKDTRF